MPEIPSSSSEITSSKIPTPKTADDINDMFRELDSEEDKTPKETKEIKEPKEEKEPKEGDDSDEEEELELVDKDEELEKLDLDEKSDEVGDIEAPPRKKEILKKYPDIFKDFPFMEKMMYRDKQYTELFGSFDDAKEIAEKSEVFNNFESQLLSGNTADILKEVKESDERAFNIIVDDYLPTLYKVDKDAYFHVTGNLNKRLIMEMAQEGEDTGNDDLKQAALLVKQFIFGSGKFTGPTLRVEDRKNPGEVDKVEAERLEFVKERFETAKDDLQTRVDNTLRATITEYIDPKGKMSPYEKKNAIVDAMKILSQSIAADGQTVKNLDKFWRASFDAKFSKDTLTKIQSFYLSKAKGQLKNAIVKARAEALKDSSPRRKEAEDSEEITEDTKPQTQRRQPTGRPGQSQKGKNEPKQGESVTDFFMRD